MNDEQRFDALVRVNPVVKTPHLDQLSKNSLFFSHAYTTNPSCDPVRAAMFTGRYPSQCGAPTYLTYTKETEVTFMRILQQAGYHTAVIGKQYFGKSDIEKGYDYTDIIDQHSASKFENSNSYSMDEKSHIPWSHQAPEI
jgi:uncharacterized sulfatase